MVESNKKRNNKSVAEAERLAAMLAFDSTHGEYRHICGVDEAGAGPLAGPVCGAAVVMPAGLSIEGINDSKKLSEKKRRLLYAEILENALTYCIVFVDNKEIDEINILQARFKAMRLAVAGLSLQPDFVLVDGNVNPLDMPSAAITKGDSKSFSIACASILAKVARDELMLEYHAKYPEYGFDRHKGYGTKAHIEAIGIYGLTEIHRRSFLRGGSRLKPTEVSD